MRPLALALCLLALAACTLPGPSVTRTEDGTITMPPGTSLTIGSATVGSKTITVIKVNSPEPKERSW